MRILQVAPPWFEVPPRHYGGTELVVANLTEELVAQGHEVTLLASGGSTTRARLVSEFATSPSAELGDPVIELAHATAIADLSDFDVVHDHTLIGATLADARDTAPVVHTLHGPFTPRLRPLLRRLGRRIHLVAISHDQTRHAPEVPVAGVIHNGIDPSGYPRTRGRGEALLFLGRASPDKGPDLAIDVARRTGRRLIMAVKVNEPDEQDFWHQVLVPHLGDADVEVVGDPDHVTKTQLLQQAHAVVMPLRWDEPFGLVMIEAAACGVPTVVFARGAAPEIVVDGVTGRLVDPAAGIAGLVAAVDDVDDVDADRCRRHVAEHFSATSMAHGYLEIYDAAVRARLSPTVVSSRGPVSRTRPA